MASRTAASLAEVNDLYGAGADSEMSDGLSKQQSRGCGGWVYEMLPQVEAMLRFAVKFSGRSLLFFWSVGRSPTVSVLLWECRRPHTTIPLQFTHGRLCLWETIVSLLVQVN